MPLKMFKEEAERRPLSEVKSIIAVAAGKGGVGKSTVTVNLALALHRLGFAVGVMDCDIYGPSVRRMLPEDRFPSQKGTTIFPALCHGIKMISMAYFRKENEASIVRAPIANNLIIQFIRQVDWGALDFLLLDFPPGTGDVQLTLSQQAQLSGAVMVTTPQEVAVMDVRKAIHMFEVVKVPLVGVVENMSYYTHEKSGEKLFLFGEGGGARLASDCGIPFLGQIPIDPDLCKYGDEGVSIFDKNDKAAAAKAFIALAENLAEGVKAREAASEGCLGSFEMAWKEFSHD